MCLCVKMNEKVMIHVYKIQFRLNEAEQKEGINQSIHKLDVSFFI